MTNLNQIEQDDVTIVRFSGSLAAVDVQAIKASFEQLTRQPGVRLVVDLAGVNMMATPAIALFVAANQVVRERGGRIVFTRITPPVGDVLHVLRLDSIFQITPELDQAVAQVKGS
ncbi:MAG: STAS domain-containing protein [Tepidisphaerales bacterium]